MREPWGWLQNRAVAGQPVSAHVEGELRSYFTCGILRFGCPREGTRRFGNRPAADAEPIDPLWGYDHRIGKSITGTAANLGIPWNGLPVFGFGTDGEA